jgi:type VI secretion system protein ImpH
LAATARDKAPGLNSNASLVEELLSRPESFSYFQAIRVIRQSCGEAGASMSRLVRRGLKIRADAALSFPGSDLVQVERLHPRRGGAEPPGGRQGPAVPPQAPADADGGAPGSAAPDPDPLRRLPDILDGGIPAAGGISDPLYRLTVTFMGLYGAASPLPHFYAQEILQDEQFDERAARELLDLVSLSSYRSHALSYFYSLLAFRVLELNDPVSRQILFAIMGEAYREESSAGDFREMKLFATKIRSAPGLVSLLQAAAPGIHLELVENVPRWVDIPGGQRAAVRGGASSLGRDMVLGVRARDLSGKFRLRARVRDLEGLEGLMPGGRVYGAVKAAVARYLASPLLWDLEIHLPPGAAEGVALGVRRGRLGLSAFLSPGGSPAGHYVLNRDPERRHRRA